MDTARKRLLPFLIAAVIGVLSLMLFAWSKGEPCPASADVGQPSGYCGFIDFTVTNNTGGDLTDQPVRFTLPVNSLVSSGRADQMGWQWYCSESAFSNARSLFIQEMSETSSAIWIVFPALPDGATRTARCYVGRAETQRDQGIYFLGNEYATAADDADFDITDNLSVSVTILPLVTPTSNQVLIEHRDAANGFRIQYETDGGTPGLLFVLDNDSCNIEWDTAWNDEVAVFRFDYISATGNDTFMYRNDVLIKECDIDQGTIAASTNDVVIGAVDSSFAAKLNNTVLFGASISDATDLVAHWLFEAPQADETDATNPYGGTLGDHWTGGHDLTYVFDRSQTDLATEVGGYTLTASNTGPTFTEPEVDIVGEILPGSAFGAVGNQNATTWPLMLFNPPSSSAIPRVAYWSLLLSAFAVIIGLLAFMMSRKVIIAVGAAGGIYTVGVSDGVLPAWWLIYWAFAVAFSVAASRWSRES